jgi:hypothetical protein
MPLTGGQWISEVSNVPTDKHHSIVGVIRNNDGKLWITLTLTPPVVTYCPAQFADFWQQAIEAFLDPHPCQTGEIRISLGELLAALESYFPAEMKALMIAAVNSNEYPVGVAMMKEFVSARDRQQERMKRLARAKRLPVRHTSLAVVTYWHELSACKSADHAYAFVSASVSNCYHRTPLSRLAFRRFLIARQLRFRPVGHRSNEC